MGIKDCCSTHSSEPDKLLCKLSTPNPHFYKHWLLCPPSYAMRTKLGGAAAARDFLQAYSEAKG